MAAGNPRRALLGRLEVLERLVDPSDAAMGRATRSAAPRRPPGRPASAARPGPVPRTPSSPQPPAGRRSRRARTAAPTRAARSPSTSAPPGAAALKGARGSIRAIRPCSFNAARRNPGGRSWEPWPAKRPQSIGHWPDGCTALGLLPEPATPRRGFPMPSRSRSRSLPGHRRHRRARPAHQPERRLRGRRRRGRLRLAARLGADGAAAPRSGSTFGRRFCLHLPRLLRPPPAALRRGPARGCAPAAAGQPDGLRLPRPPRR